jgi:hypothetical protein
MIAPRIASARNAERGFSAPLSEHRGTSVVSGSSKSNPLATTFVRAAAIKAFTCTFHFLRQTLGH